MAQMYPPEFMDGPWSEQQVFEALRGLSDSWHVIHDVAFPVESASDPVEDGQADLVLMHPDKGVLVIEVKGGSVRAEMGVWTSSNAHGDHAIKDPFKQVTRNKYGLLRQFRKNFGLDPWIMHAVAFPSTAKATGPIGIHPTEFVIFREDLEDPVAVIDRVIAAHQPRPQNLSTRRLGEIARRLAPTVTIRRTLADLVGEVNQELIRLTEQQRQVLQMTRSLKRVWISGGAGTGKTILAVERARQLSAEGDRVLLLCFNRALGAHIERMVTDIDSVDAGSYHHLAARLAGSSRPPLVSEDKWLDVEFSAAFFDHCVAEKVSWNAILIDEGQDFRSEWLEALEQLLADDDSRLIVFADPNQNLFRCDGIAGLPAEPLHLDINCRNTPQINRRANAAIGMAVECLSRLDGLEPNLTVAPDRAGLLRALRSELHRLIVDEGIAPTDVAILSPSRSLVAQLRATRIGRWSTVSALDGGLVCETVQRFKGLERDAIVLLLPDDGPFDSMLGYVAMSRAKSLLSVISESPPADQLNWG